MRVLCGLFFALPLLCGLAYSDEVPCSGRKITIDNTKPKLSKDGDIVNAHDGTYRKIGGFWYYHGAEYGLCHEPQKHGCDKTPDHCGFHNNHNVSVWRSTDLSSGSWEKVATAVECTKLPGCQVLYRPHLVFNPNTQKYVLFVNYVGQGDQGYKGNAVYSALHPEGPFHLENPVMNLSRLCPGPVAGPQCGEAQGACGDFDVLVDPADGQAYISYGCHYYMGIERLTADYYNTAPLPASGNGNATVTNGHFGGRLFPDYFIEAPVFFERNGLYYLLYGHCCCFCYQGSGILVYIAEHPLGPWKAQPGGNLACVPPPQDNFEREVLGGTPTPGQGCLYGGSSDVSTTHAQQNFVINYESLDGKIKERIWTGDLWQQSPDGLKGHEGQFWVPLRFTEAGHIQKVRHVDSFQLCV